MISTTKRQSLCQTSTWPISQSLQQISDRRNIEGETLLRPSISAIGSASVINYKELGEDQALDAEFMRFIHSSSTTLNFKLIKTFDNNLVWCDVSTGHTRPYVTPKFRRKVFTSLHGLGHPSHRATKLLINTCVIWHSMNKDVANWCRKFKGCQTAKVSRHNRPVFGKFTEPTERLDHVHINIVGPLPYSEGFKYLLTCVDQFARWPEAIPLVDIKNRNRRRCFLQWVDSLFRDSRHHHYR